jgi:hypothetical protein
MEDRGTRSAVRSFSDARSTTGMPAPVFTTKCRKTQSHTTLVDNLDVLGGACVGGWREPAGRAGEKRVLAIKAPERIHRKKRERVNNIGLKHTGSPIFPLSMVQLTHLNSENARARVHTCAGQLPGGEKPSGGKPQTRSSFPGRMQQQNISIYK